MRQLALIYVVAFFYVNVYSQNNEVRTNEFQDSIVTQDNKKPKIINPGDLQIIQPISDSPWLHYGSNIYYNTGNVGIGTSSPSNKLHVYSSGWKAQFSGPDGYIMIGPANSSWAHIYTDRPNFILNKDIYTITGGYSSYNSSNFYLKTNGTTRMTILNSNGNVGIGKTSPSKKLDVNGDINFSGNLYKNGQLVDFSTSELSASIWTIVENESGDDGSAIQAALNANTFVSLRPNATYNFSQKITIPENTTLQIPSGCTLLFTGNSSSQESAIEMKSFATLVGDGRLKLNRAMWDMSSEKIGIIISGHTNKIEFGTVEGFEIGLYMSSWTTGVGWNNINVRHIYDCVIGLVMYKNGENAWINQNYFHVDDMSEHRTSSSTTAKQIWDTYSVGIKMDNYGNTNMFSGAIEGYNVGIQLMGKYNRIESVRLESCKTRIRLVGTGGQNGTEHNYLYSPYGEISGLTSTSGGSTPIVNDTGDPLYTVLNVFGFDFITYLHYLYSSGSYVSSDYRLKYDINDTEGALNKVLALRGTTYKLKTNEKSSNPDTLRKYGFIAQELKEVLPELVEKNPLDGMYAINYDGVIPVLVEAFKEQQKLIENRENDIAELKKMNQNLVTILTEKGILADSDFNEISEESILYQNTPNPFNSETEIGFYLPQYVKEAYILVMDMNGKMLKQIDVYSRGNDSVIVGSNEFNSGMYIYTLIADGKVVGTNRMILTE